MASLVETLFAAIRDIPLIDPHSHINPHAPAAASLNDLLGYHYYTELAHSAGLPKDRVEGVTGLDQCRHIAGRLVECDNTVQVQWLVHLAHTFFGFADDRLTPDNVEGLYHAAAERCAEPDWADAVRRATNLEAIFLTNDFDDPLAGFDTDVYVPCLRTDDLVFKLHEPAVRERFARATGHAPANWNDVTDGLDRLFEHFVAKGARACAISLPPWFEPTRPLDVRADADLAEAALGADNEESRRSLAYAVFYAIADHCERHGLPFDLMIGVHRDVYPAGVHQGRDLFDQRTSLYQFRHLFNEKPHVVFPVSVLTSNQNQELASYAWIFPNVVTSGHWWYANVPAYIEADLRARLDAVPGTKQIGYYSDAYKLEFVLPKYDMYRRTLATVLARDFVDGRGWPEERAVDLARRLLRDNVLRWFPARRVAPAGEKS